MRQRVMATLRQRHREGGITPAALARDPRRVRRHRHQHHRRVLPVAAARVSARGRRRSRLRPRRRNRNAALHRSLARQRAGDRPRDLARRSGRGAAVHRARRAAAAQGADGAARSPAGGARRAQSVSARPRDERRRRLRAAACTRCAARCRRSPRHDGRASARAFAASGPTSPGFDLLALEMRRADGDPTACRRRGCAACSIGCPISCSRKRASRASGSSNARRSSGQPPTTNGTRRSCSASARTCRRRSRRSARDINLVLARGVRRLFAIAQDEYRRTLDKHGVLDFPDLLERTLKLLGQMEEFSRSRYRLESRYEHVLVDEFQDTSRAQWRLVRELVRAWARAKGSATARSRRRSSSSATASSRSTASATPRSPCSTRRRHSSTRCGPKRRRARRSPAAFARSTSC